MAEKITLLKIKEPNENNFKEIDLLIGASGKMYINPTIEDLRDESFAMVRGYHNMTNVSTEEILERWNKNEKFEFVD